jgi:hypothetical protein
MERSEKIERNENLDWVSLTGAEDSVDPADLAAISADFPRAEWALLGHAEREGSGRNPSRAWRERFLDAIEGKGRSALHLCGAAAFERLLAEGPWEELGRYDRVQANVNSRGPIFDDAQIWEIWRLLATGTRGLIIQVHANVEELAKKFVADRSEGMAVSVLFDESKGRGKLPGQWRESWAGIGCGSAGGLGPENVAAMMPGISAASREPGCWIDMETRLRTGKHFDLAKARAVLEAAEPWMSQRSAGS